MGFRYEKEVNGETHNYIFDGWSITAETNKDGELKSREVRGYGLVKKETDNKQYYYHQNEHGDITHLTNIDEEIENSYQYDVFGNIREQQENVENVFKYAGEQLDNETQQYYLRARFYNPVIARFTQEDIYRDDGLNLYVYVVNNPLLWIDPSGHEKCPSDDKKNYKVIKSEHAQIRATQGRNVNTAINDLNKAKPSNIYLQDDGRYVIKGSNGRVHILEPDGELVTTMNSVTNFDKRVSSGRYTPLGEIQKGEFAQKFGSYLNSSWSSYK